MVFLSPKPKDDGEGHVLITFNIMVTETANFTDNFLHFWIGDSAGNMLDDKYAIKVWCNDESDENYITAKWIIPNSAWANLDTPEGRSDGGEVIVAYIYTKIDSNTSPPILKWGGTGQSSFPNGIITITNVSRSILTGIEIPST